MQNDGKEIYWKVKNNLDLERNGSQEEKYDTERNAPEYDMIILIYCTSPIVYTYKQCSNEFK
jgi:hypothetical protein